MIPGKPGAWGTLRLASLLALSLVLSPPASGQTGGLDAASAVGPYFNGVFPVSAPGQATGWETVNAFPNLTFVDPLWLTEIPATDDLLLVGKNGRLWRFPNRATVTQAEVVPVLDWAARTQTSEDQGFYSLVFHPEFGQPGSPARNHVYVCYNHRPALAGADANRSYWRVSRFTWQPATGTIDPDSEFVLMNQYDRCRWHNGGAMFFGADGFLHVNCGDGGDSGEGGGLTGPDGALSRTQRLDGGLFSGVFRIDVDNDPAKSHPIRRQPGNPANKPAGWPDSFTRGYGIPNDNPWQDEGGGMLEEYWSLGLRSPHTMHPDPVTGDIWIGDVGEGAREEMTRAPKGSNAQWGFMEGSIGGPGDTPSPIIGVSLPPDLDYNRSTGTCIIGGMRYRGAKWDSQLGGKLLFGDHVRGRIWTADLVEGGPPVVTEIVSGLPTGNKAGLANFCTDTAGEVYLTMVNGTNQAGGTIRKLVAAGTSTEPPALLSQTGVFTDLGTLATAAGVIPYDVATPLWSDASAKRRWIIVPNDGIHDSAAEKIVFREAEPWIFPAGTVFVKHFETVTAPGVVKRLETRFLICTEGGGKYGFTYKWRPDGSDAELLTGGLSESYQTTGTDGSTTSHNWDYPSRADCLLCHNTASGQALGVNTHQLNHDLTYAITGRRANQLATFNALGFFDTTLTAGQIRNFLESRAIDDTAAPIEHRVRSYLDANCSHCHRPGGSVEHFDARLGTPLQAQGLIDGLIQGHYSLGPDGRYLKPGDPSLSAVQVRLANVGNGAAMPPLAKNRVDAKAVALLQEYVESLRAEEFEKTPSPRARYVRLTALSELNGNPWTAVGEFSILDGNASPIPISDLSIHDFDSQELVDEFAPAARVIDGNTGTFWHTEWGAVEPQPPHHVTIDIGSLREIGGYVYTPRQGSQNGRIADYRVDYSTDGTSWIEMDAGTWANGTATRTFSGLTGRRKARCQVAGPSGTVSGSFDVTIVFDMKVDDFDAADISVQGGQVTDLRGSGYYYVARISPAAPQVVVTVPQDSANGEGLGSNASLPLVLGFTDTEPPRPAFTRVPAVVGGPFELGLTFGETVSGLTAGDFTITNGTLASLVADGPDYRLQVIPLAEGSVTVELAAGTVVDLAGLRSTTGASVTVSHLTRVLARDAADHAGLSGGMVMVNDPAAPGGAYVWLPDGTFPDNFNLPVKTQHRAEYRFVVPHAGQWRLRGLVRSADSSSDSFWVEIDGRQGLGTVYLWDTAPVGTAFAWDYLNHRNVMDPVVLDLSAGEHLVSVYGRDDGTRLARLELESVRPLATLTGPSGVVDGPFPVTVTFSAPVTGLTAGDFTVGGGTASTLTGSGASYVLQVVPTSGLVTVLLPENSVTDGTGTSNPPSNGITVVHRTSYQQWALDHGVDGSEATLLADEDGDGIAKLLEFAFGLDPKVPDASDGGMPRLVMGPEPSLSLTYLRRKGVPALTYTPQFGGTPAAFADSTGPLEIEDLGELWERVVVRDPGAGDSVRFGRVAVSLSAPASPP